MSGDCTKAFGSLVSTQNQRFRSAQPTKSPEVPAMSNMTQASPARYGVTTALEMCEAAAALRIAEETTAYVINDAGAKACLEASQLHA